MNKRILLKSMLALAALATTAASARSHNTQAEPDLPAQDLPALDAQEAQARYSSRYFFIRPRRRMFLFRKRRGGPPLPGRPVPTIKPVPPVTP